MDPSTQTRLGIIIVAAGAGTRLGAGLPKAFVDVGGRSLLVRSVTAACALPGALQVVVVAPVDRVDEALRRCAPAAAGSKTELTVVSGGETRQESVAAGLRALGADIEIVLVHDAARALTPTSQFASVAEAVARLGHGVIPVLAVSDTIKRVDSEGHVIETVDRSELASVQTPQGFPRAQLDRAYARATHEYTDDAALAAAAGMSVTVVDGDPMAFKVTTPWDRARAEELTGQADRLRAEAHGLPADAFGSVLPSAAGIRVGIGSDTHAFDSGRPLWLCGLLWPDEPGLAGHSDGDAACHAITDALLSAAGLGDIGGLFGTDDPRYAGASGETFLRETRELLVRNGFRIGNVSVQLTANRPRFSPRRSEAEEMLSRILRAPVSVTATTTDGLGFTGRGEGVAAIATAVVVGEARD